MVKATYDVSVVKEPEHNPNQTTGDPVEPTELSVGLSVRPSEQQIALFEREYPPHLYSAFHYVEGIGKIYETPK